MRYFLGLDNGGTTTKAALYDELGREVGICSAETKAIYPHISFVERDMEEMWKANCSVISGVIASSGVNPSDIAGIAVCGHGKGLYLWGRDDHPVRNGIISTDNRAWNYPLLWKSSGVAAEVRKISCQDIMACQPVSLLSWLRDNEPEALAETKFIFEAKDYVRFRLTGEAYAERSDYSGANLLNLHTGEYDPALLGLFGLSDCIDKLPPLRNSMDICGAVTEEAARETGLKPGTPVAGGAFDIDSCVIAVNVTDDRHVCMIAGTWSINEYVRTSPIMDDSVRMNSLFCIPGRYLIEESSPTSAGNIDWFVRNVMRSDDKSVSALYREMDRWVEDVSPDTFCPVFLPFIMASNVNPNAMGSFVGINSFHDISHLSRSMFEGVAFSHRYHYEKLLSSMPRNPESIRLAGGVTNSRIWTQIFADVLKSPVECITVKETGALGCAIIAAVATGAYPSLEEAASKMCHVSRTIYPQEKDAGIYDRKYALYLSVIDSLDSFWGKVQESGLRR